MIGNANGIDLNNATVSQIARIGGIGPDLAARLVDRRPLLRWADLETIPGFDHEMVNDLRGSGAKLGRPTASSMVRRPYHRILRSAQSDHSAAKKRRSGPSRPPRNIFSGKGRDR